MRTRFNLLLPVRACGGQTWTLKYVSRKKKNATPISDSVVQSFPNWNTKTLRHNPHVCVGIRLLHHPKAAWWEMRERFVFSRVKQQAADCTVLYQPSVPMMCVSHVSKVHHTDPCLNVTHTRLHTRLQNEPHNGCSMILFRNWLWQDWFVWLEDWINRYRYTEVVGVRKSECIVQSYRRNSKDPAKESHRIQNQPTHLAHMQIDITT